MSLNIDHVDAADALLNLRQRGYGPLLDQLGRKSAYHANGRLIHSKLAKRMNMTASELQQYLQNAQRAVEGN